MSARDRLVYSTIDLIRRRGVAGTGVAEILDHGKVSRRSIYLNFPGGKTELAAEATRAAGHFIGNQIAALTTLPSLRDALAAFIATWKAIVTDSGFLAGCPVAAAAHSRTDTPAVADRAGEAFDHWQSTLADSLQERGLERSAARSLANTVLAAIEGAVTLCIARQSVTALDDVERHLGILLDHHLPAD